MCQNNDELNLFFMLEKYSLASQLEMFLFLAIFDIILFLSLSRALTISILDDQSMYSIIYGCSCLHGSCSNEHLSYIYSIDQSSLRIVCGGICLPVLIMLHCWILSLCTALSLIIARVADPDGLDLDLDSSLEKKSDLDPDPTLDKQPGFNFDLKKSPISCFL